MKRVIAIIMIATQTIGLSARINFGSRESAIEATGGTVALGASKALSRGTLRDRGAGSITGTTLTCNEMTIETRDGTSTRSMKADGAVTLAGDIVLSDSDVLTVDGGSVPGTVKADGLSAASILRGSGTFANDIEVNNSNTSGSDGDEKDRSLQIEWDGELNVNVQLNGAQYNAATLTLGSDLVFAPGKSITCNADVVDENIVASNGHALIFNGDSTIASGDAISLDTGIIVNNGLLTINDTVKVKTGAMKFTGGRIAGSAGFDGNSLGGTFSDVQFTHFDENTLGTSSCTWTLNNCILGEEDNTEILEVKQGGLTGGKTDVFDGETTWVDYSVVNMLDDVTLGNTWTAGDSMVLNGGGHVLDLGSTTLNDGDNSITLSNIIIREAGNNGLVTTDAGTQIWTFKNVILEDTTNNTTVEVKNGSLYAPPGGTNPNPTAAEVYWSGGYNTVQLLSDLAMPARWAVLTGCDFHLAGNGHTLDTTSGGFLSGINGSEVFVLSDATIKNLQTGTFQTQRAIASSGGFITLRGVTLEGSNGSQANSMTVTGKLKQNNDNDTGSGIYYADVYNEAEGTVSDVKVAWSDTPKFSLNSDIYLTNNWQFATGTEIAGNGYALDLSSSDALLDIDGTFALTNITLRDVAGANIDTQGAQTITMQDVKWHDASAGALHIHGANAAATAPASVSLYNTITNADNNTGGDAVGGSIFGSTGGTIAVEWGSAGVAMSLLDNCTLSHEWQFDGTSRIDGNGYSFTFEDGETTPTIDLNANLTLNNIKLTNVTLNSFDANGTAALLMNNVEWHDSAKGAVRFGGCPYVAGNTHGSVVLASGAANGDIFTQSMTTTINGASIDLLSNITGTGGTWDFSTNVSSINGNGHVWKADGTVFDTNVALYLSEVIITEIADTTFANAGGSSMYLSNVVLADAANNGMIRVNASTVAGAQDKAQVTLNGHDTQTDLFTRAVTFNNGANIDLMKDTTLATTWTFSDDTIINGNGNHFDLKNAVLTVADTKTLHLRNMIIDNLDTDSFSDVGAAESATFTLSDCTVILSESIDWSAYKTNIQINGPVTFVTGTKTFVAPSGHATVDSAVNGVTVWYDTLGNTVASARVSGFGGTGRVAEVGASSAGAALVYADGSTTEIVTSYDLSPDGSSATGTQAIFNGGTDFTFDGNGNTFYIADVTDASTKPVLTVSGTTVVDMVNVTLDGFQEDAISLASTNDDQMIFNVGSILRLQSDQDLTQTLTFAKGSGITTSQTYSSIIDLNGHELDVTDAAAELKIQDEANLNLLIKNGRLKVSGDNVGVLSSATHSNTQTITFEDVELLLSADTTLTSSNIVFKGNCSVIGGRPKRTSPEATFDKALHFWHTPVTIDTGATLYVGNSTKIGLNGNGTSTDASLAFTSSNSTLFLDGATLGLTTASSDTYTFETGTLKVDGITTFDIGSGNTLELGNVGSGTNKSIEVDLQPGASIVVSTGTLDYQDDEDASNDD